ncbi:SLC13 family permease [Providencia vermicola]|uniref:SLC13 family permease n=1 Tax=Providencia vermicola TaxID=333965 RepID=A0AAX3S6M0_9GAMM|nr:MULTISPECIES: SLC13 family permease [Providencia]ELR5119464.1 transporter [Providencia stuartii]ELX8379563.1 transporter [Providencia stuartii]EMD5258767.1 transporter [Providencia stuartii]QIC15567.1 transporter [Providencia vermicola]USB35693.1 SLC13 family permease [Providencia vermicola]
MSLTIIIFLLVYVAMGFGKLPGFKVDRTGAAVIGALAMMAVGSITPPHAWNAIDYRTIGMLFGLMVVSASFVVSGFYSWTANRVAMLNVSAPVLLAVLIAVGGLLSALLTNDVVVVAMTPLLVSITLSRGLNPIPFLLGFCFAANNGASGSLIGSPQNMIAAQGLDISFIGLLQASAIPALLSLPITWAILVFLYRNRWYLAKTATTPSAPTAPTDPATKLDVWETTKAGIITFIVIIAFVISDIPRELIALTAAGFLLLNRSIASSDMLKLVDGNLLLLIMGLFVVNAAFASTGLPQQMLNDLRSNGVELNNPIVLFLVTGVLSTIVGNNPAVMLLVPFLSTSGNADSLGAALVLGSGFSSNLFVFGSLAGIIVVEQAAAYGVKISFSEFAKSGGIVALLCMLLAAAWIVLVL